MVSHCFAIIGLLTFADIFPQWNVLHFLIWNLDLSLPTVFSYIAQVLRSHITNVERVHYDKMLEWKVA